MYKAKHVDTEKALNYIKERRNRYYQECEAEKQKVDKFYSGVQMGIDIAEDIFMCSNYEADESDDSELGEWERLGENATVCSKCGKGLSDSHGYGFVLNEFAYCPFCGREMKVRKQNERRADIQSPEAV